MKGSIVFFVALFSSTALLIAQDLAPSRVVPASATVTGGATPSTTDIADRAPRYQLRGGDSFEVQFAFTPELNQTVTVQPDGYITLKSVGAIPAEGLTIEALTGSIERAYMGILHDPVVTIDLKDFEKPFFIVTGQVGRPGKYDLRSDLTVIEGVAIAGGFTEASMWSQVVLFRPGENGLTEARLIDVKKMLKSRDLTQDITLHPGDMIFVPQNRISKIQKYIPTSSLGMYGSAQTY